MYIIKLILSVFNSWTDPVQIFCQQFCLLLSWGLPKWIHTVFFHYFIQKFSSYHRLKLFIWLLFVQNRLFLGLKFLFFVPAVLVALHYLPDPVAFTFSNLATFSTHLATSVGLSTLPVNSQPNLKSQCLRSDRRSNDQGYLPPFQILDPSLFGWAFRGHLDYFYQS